MQELISYFTDIHPGTWVGAIAVGLTTAVILWAIRRTEAYVPGTDEYQARVRQQAIFDAAATQNNEVIFNGIVNQTEIKIFSGDITKSSASVIVSSDDTLLSATGGVANSIVQAAGKKVLKRMRKIAKSGVPRGALAITDGGNTEYKYIFHAVVLTKASDHTEYPSKDEIQRLVFRIISTADAAGIESIALPIIAGGVAAKKLSEQGLKTEQQLIYFIAEAVKKALTDKITSLRVVFLVVYDEEDLSQELTTDLTNFFSTSASETLSYA